MSERHHPSSPMVTFPLNAGIPIRTEAEARRLLGPYFSDLVAINEHGFREWERLGGLDRTLRASLSPRARANFIYDHMVAEARRRLGGKPGVVLCDNRGFLTIHIGSEFVIRLKKLDARGKSRNVPTRQQWLWSRQRHMFGLGQETRVTAGYQLNALATGILDIKLVCPNGGGNAWGFSVLKEGDNGTQTSSIVPLPTAPPSETVLKVNPARARRRKGRVTEKDA